MNEPGNQEAENRSNSSSRHQPHLEVFHPPPVATPAVHIVVSPQTTGEPPSENEISTPEADSSILEKGFTRKGILYWFLVSLSSITLVVSFISSSLLGRFYFTGGGQSRWLYTFTQSAAFPMPACILIILRMRWKRTISTISVRALCMYLALGALIAVDNLFYSWSVSYLPISTVGLLGSSHLAFTALFAFGLVKKKLTPFSTNTLVVVTLSACLLGLNSNSDHPKGIDKKKYTIGFFMALLANLLYGLYLPLMELVLNILLQEHQTKSARSAQVMDTNEQKLDDHSSDQSRKSEIFLVLEMQTLTTAFATAFVFIAMISAGHLQSLHHEMVTFKGGLWVYWTTLVCGAIGWQLTLLATLGVILLTSSLFAGVLSSSNLPFLPLCSVFFFHDHFGGLKAIAMALSLWGFASYLYGGYEDSL